MQQYFIHTAYTQQHMKTVKYIHTVYIYLQEKAEILDAQDMRNQKNK